VRYLWVYSKWPQTNVTNDQDICDDGERPKDFIKVIMTAFQKKPQAKKMQRPLHLQQR